MLQGIWDGAEAWWSRGRGGWEVWDGPDGLVGRLKLLFFTTTRTHTGARSNPATWEGKGVLQDAWLGINEPRCFAQRESNQTQRAKGPKKKKKRKKERKEKKRLSTFPSFSIAEAVVCQIPVFSHNHWSQRFPCQEHCGKLSEGHLSLKENESSSKSLSLFLFLFLSSCHLD